MIRRLFRWAAVCVAVSVIVGSWLLLRLRCMIFGHEYRCEPVRRVSGPNGIEFEQEEVCSRCMDHKGELC